MSQSRNLRPLDPIFSPGKRLGAIAVGNTPAVEGGSPAYETPRWSWSGVMNTLKESPEWRMNSAQTYDECTVDFLIDDDVIEFDILVNGSIVDSVVCSTGLAQEFAVDVAVVRDDKITLDLTDFASGLAEEVVVMLRRAV